MTKKYDVVIVGAGIAGMTAGIYARRAGKKVLVLESKTYGGQIINTLEIENWPGDFKVSGADLSKKIHAQMVELGAEIEFEDVEAISGQAGAFLIKTDETEYEADRVILAVGAEHKKIGLPREDELVGRGISYCATCDGAFFKDKIVAVIGGGNTALYDALYLCNLAKKVYLVHRRDEFRGDTALVERVRVKKNIELVLGYVPEEILGEEKVTSLKLVPSEMVSDVTEPLELMVEGIFVAIGEKPSTERFGGLVKLDENGYIIAGEDCKTSCPGIFAVGDCRTKDVRQLVTAAADGAVAGSFKD